jgi:FkbM family methyltransferase
VVRAALALYSVAQRSGFLRTKFGDALFVRAYFAYKRLIEDPFAALVRSAPELFAGGHIIDVGANIGYTASVFASALTKGYRVFAFEPESENFARLERTITRLRLTSRVEPVSSAVGDQTGTIALWRNERHHGDHRVVTSVFARSHSGFTTVPMTTIDAFVSERAIAPVSFVKIDVQGFEPAVIAGMLTLMQSNPSVAIAVELCPAALSELGFTAADTTGLLQSEGFTPFLFRQKRLQQTSPGEAARVASARGYVDVIWRRVV